MPEKTRRLREDEVVMFRPPEPARVLDMQEGNKRVAEEPAVDTGVVAPCASQAW